MGKISAAGYDVVKSENLSTSMAKRDFVAAWIRLLF